jgi:hypothetical protein
MNEIALFTVGAKSDELRSLQQILDVFHETFFEDLQFSQNTIAGDDEPRVGDFGQYPVQLVV